MFYLACGFLFGFLVSFLVLKQGLRKQGAGKCGMCKTCDYHTFYNLKGGDNNADAS